MNVAEYANILLIRPSALGDVCRTVPVLAALRARFPRARIDWLVQDSFADAISAHPALTNVVPFERSRMSKWYTPGGAKSSLSLLHFLRAQKYELVIDAQGLARSALFARVTGAPVRVGPSDAREGGKLAYTHRVDCADQVHTVEKMMALLAGAGVNELGAARREMQLYVPRTGLAWFAEQRELTGGCYAVFAPTSRWPGKQWPDERFAQLAQRVLDDRAMNIGRVFFVGGGNERDQVPALTALAQRDARVVDWLGRTSIAQLMALVSRTSLLIANDSAALHMGVGFSRSLVALYGPTDVAKVGPYGYEKWTLQHRRASDVLDHKDASKGRAMMERITVDEVHEMAARALGASDQSL